MKNLLLIALFIFFSLFLTPIISAGFDEDYQAFLKTYDSYRNAHNIYLTTRNQYLAYKTLNAKNDALEATKNLLFQRDDVLLKYFLLLQDKNSDSAFSSQLDIFKNLLTTNQQKSQALGSLEDATTISQEVESKNIEMQSLSRKMTVGLFIQKLSALYSQYKDIESKTKEMIANLKAQGKDTATLERWLLDAQNKTLLYEQKISDINNQSTTDINIQNVDDLNSKYNSLQISILDAKQYLSEAISFISELSQNIKYGQY